MDGTRNREREGGGVKRRGGGGREVGREAGEEGESGGEGRRRGRGGWDGRSRGKGVKVRWEARGMAPLSQDLSLGLAHALSLRPPDRDLGYSFP